MMKIMPLKKKPIIFSIRKLLRFFVSTVGVDIYSSMSWVRGRTAARTCHQDITQTLEFSASPPDKGCLISPVLYWVSPPPP